MAATKHLGVRDALATLYQAAPALSLRIIENRDVALPEGVSSQIHVYRVDSQPDVSLMGGTSAPVDWSTTLRTVIKARKSALSSAEAIADDLAGSCYARVLADPSLGGTVMQLTPGAFEWDQDEADTSVATVTWDLTVLHRTGTNTIT